jgi:hypothetical protein
VVAWDSAPPTEFSGNPQSGLCMAQTNLYVLAPPALCAHEARPLTRTAPYLLLD